MTRRDEPSRNDQRRTRGTRRERLALRFLRVLRLTSCLVFAAYGASGTVIAQQSPPQTPSQPPRFSTSVEVTSLDVSVVDTSGKPITDLKPPDFNVRIDGNARRVVTSEWISLVTPSTADVVAAVPDGYSTNEGSTGGRLIVLAVDEPNIRFGGAMAIAKAANAFIDRLSPSDRIAVASFGTGAPATVFTSDRERIKKAIGRMAGQKQAGRTADLGHQVSYVEAQAIENGDRATLEGVFARECQGLERSPAALEQCRQQVELEARVLAQDTRREADQTIQSLRDLFAGLAQFDAPKTMVLISEGFAMSDQAMILELGQMAALARTSLYALKLDNQFFDVSDGRNISTYADRQAKSEGLDLLAGAARGTIFTATGSGQTLFDRIASEISGYYLLAVESDPKDRDGKAHSVRIDVPRRGALVRSRRQVMNTPAERKTAAARARSPRQAVASALASPLLTSALPLRIVSFALKGPEAGKVQLLIHADIGTDYAAPRTVSTAYVITDQNGNPVDNKAYDARLAPVMNGVPGALQFTTGASLAPGDYTVKLAAGEGERIGTIEHPIHASLPDAGGLTLSELMVGAPIEVGELLQPTISYLVTFGTVHGYVEAYGPSVDGVTVEYEIATDPKAPALFNVDVAPRRAGEARVIFTRVMPVHQLPPGKYILRAIFSTEGRSIKTLTRPFEIAAPKVLLTSADGLGDTSVDAELFLPVDEASMTPAFKRDEPTDAETLAAFRDRVDEKTKSAFEEGISLLTAGEYRKAEVSFKKAIDPDSESTAALVYLAAAFASSGHDDAAASAWQTALIDGAELPQIFWWLGEALLRSHDFAQARTIYEEAVGKWPSDVRFTRPLAMLYGTFGRGREAVRTLERYLAQRDDDAEAYYRGVLWLYTVHAAGALVHSRAEDLKLAHTYADAYAKASGTQIALVKQWIDFLDNEKR